MRVLIIKTSSLGDVIHALPVIDYLLQVSAGIEIDWIVEEPFLPVLEHNPHLARNTEVPVRPLFQLGRVRARIDEPDRDVGLAKNCAP